MKFVNGRRAPLSSTVRLRALVACTFSLKAVNCRTGESLAQERLSGQQERVLNAFGMAAAKLRGKLGESLTTVQKLDTPVEQATTASLEALQAYGLGREVIEQKGDYDAAVPLFERAISLDPMFAMAYATLGSSYAYLGKPAYRRRTRARLMSVATE